MSRKEAKLRAAIVAEALSWELTPYHDNARIKGTGVDCAQLPCAVFGPEGVGMTPLLEPQYTSQWMMHRDEELYLAHVMPYTHEIAPEDVQPGDLVMWKFGRVYSHSAIVIDPPVILHALKRVGRVVRGDMNTEADLVDRPRRAFSLFPLKPEVKRTLRA